LAGLTMQARAADMLNVSVSVGSARRVLD
jgi:hypothetical protein